MSDKANTMMALQAIRAKLQQLQMQQEQPQKQQQMHKSEDSHSFNTPTTMQHSGSDPSSSQNTTSSLHLPEQGKVLSNPGHTQFAGSSVQQPLTSLSSQGQRSNSAVGVSETSCSKLTGSLLNTSTNRTADLTDRSLSTRAMHMADFASVPGVENEGYPRKVLNVSSKTANKEKTLSDIVPPHSCQSLEVSQSSLHSGPEQRSQESWFLGRRNCQNTEEFKIPKPASGYTDSQMEIRPKAGDRSSDDMSVTDMPSFTHPTSASKHSIQHFSSTPGMRSSAVKAPMSQLRMSSLNLGKPMRVRVQQHPVHMLSKEEEDDTDLLNSVRPLNPSSHASTGRFASLASSGYHSDITLTTEYSTPSQATSSAHRNLPLIALSSAAEHKPLTKPAESKKPVLPSHNPSAALAAPPLDWMAPVMSTPSSKGPPMQAAVMHTPTGMMESVTVNGEEYFVLKKVGRGGSAQVYMVLDVNKKICALKVVNLEGAGPEVVDGFRNEIRLLQRLQYCNSVIKMFNFELNKTLNCLYVVLEFGETDLSGFFSARAKQGQGLDPNLIKFYWGEMLRAVNALHKEGVIHSDLKPANFMLVAGNLKLIDFGIANTLQQDNTSVLKDSRVGTPSYMSPEAIMAACGDNTDDSMDEKENQTRPKYKVGVRSDVWSLGCILYNMVYGRTPFQHIRNNMGKLQAITNPAVRIKFPDLPDPHLLDVLKKCLTREVKSRPTTAELLTHPYLKNQDKENDECHTPPSKVAKIPSTVAAVTTTSGANPKETHRLQELLKSHLVEGSPRTASAVNRVMDLLQELESGKR